MYSVAPATLQTSRTECNVQACAPQLCSQQAARCSISIWSVTQKIISYFFRFHPGKKNCGWKDVTSYRGYDPCGASWMQEDVAYNCGQTRKPHCCITVWHSCCACFVCLFVGIKPRKLYSSSYVGGEVNPLGVITHGQKHKPRAYQRQQHRPRMCQSMVNTLQVDGLARITGLRFLLNDSSSATERCPPMPCMTYWFWARGGVKQWAIWWIAITNCPST